MMGLFDDVPTHRRDGRMMPRLILRTGLLASLAVAVLLALAPLAYAESGPPVVTAAHGGFSWESPGEGEWGYKVDVSQCEDSNKCHPTEFEVERIPGKVQVFEVYAQDLKFTPEGNEVYVGVAVMMNRSGTVGKFLQARVPVEVVHLVRESGVGAPKRLWSEGSQVLFDKVGTEWGYKIAVSKVRRCFIEGCREQPHYLEIPKSTTAPQVYSPCIGPEHIKPEWTGGEGYVYIGVGDLQNPGTENPRSYYGSEVAVQPPRCPPPKAEAGGASLISQSSAVLSGAVNPDESAVTGCYFEYGTTGTSYTSSVPCAVTPAGNGTQPVPVSATIGNLFPGTPYHYRLIATGLSGTAESQPAEFSTLEFPREKHPPRDILSPSISGTGLAGLSLAAGAGVWENNPTSYGYQWQRCDRAGTSCADIVGATTATFPLSVPDVEHRLRVLVTAQNADGAGQAASGPSHVVGSTVASGAIWEWREFERAPFSTLVESLLVERIPVGGVVTLTCRGRSCPFHARNVSLAAHLAKCRRRRPCHRGKAAPLTAVTLAYPFGHRRFRPGTVLGVSVTKPGWVGHESRLTIRRKREKPAVSCLAPASTRATACPS